MMPRRLKPQYKLTIEAEPDESDPAAARRLRWLLKRLLRQHRLKCLRIEQVHQPDETELLIERALLADGGEMTA